PLPHPFATAPAQADIESDDVEETQTDDEYVDVTDEDDIDHASWNWEDAQNALRRFRKSGTFLSLQAKLLVPTLHAGA
ncbi:hypothetical protein AAVH_23766, partial [Aphelenchoides avenae]